MSLKPVKVRVLEHHSSIRNWVIEALLVVHYVETNHSYEDLRFCVIHKYSRQLYNRADVQKMFLDL